jgi:hypothetical protein
VLAEWVDAEDAQHAEDAMHTQPLPSVVENAEK